jgi:putative membrane protein
MIEASMSSQFGIESGKVALKKSESGKIRELANKIINDSMNANNEIRRMAAERSVVVPSQLDQAHRELVTRLEQTDKATFDTEFLRMQASAHREAIQLFETQSQAGKDEASKQFARNNLPALQAHLTEAESPFNTASEK